MEASDVRASSWVAFVAGAVSLLSTNGGRFGYPDVYVMLITLIAPATAISGALYSLRSGGDTGRGRQLALAGLALAIVAAIVSVLSFLRFDHVNNGNPF